MIPEHPVAIIKEDLNWQLQCFTFSTLAYLDRLHVALTFPTQKLQTVSGEPVDPLDFEQFDAEPVGYLPKQTKAPIRGEILIAICDYLCKVIGSELI